MLDDYGTPPEKHGHMSIYAWTPPLVNASKPAGEWQTVDIVLVGNRVTVTLNGQKVHDNAEIQAITGGALDANETEPGTDSDPGRPHQGVVQEDHRHADQLTAQGSGLKAQGSGKNLRVMLTRRFCLSLEP